MLINNMFWPIAIGAIMRMKDRGLLDNEIAGIVSDIRAAAIQEERHRVSIVAMQNPPYFPTLAEMREDIASQSAE